MSETYFLSAGADEIEERSGSGSLLRRYVPGPGIDRPIAMLDYSSGSEVLRFFRTDRHGSTIAMTDASGTKVEGPYSYDPYGGGAPALQTLVPPMSNLYGTSAMQ